MNKKTKLLHESYDKLGIDFKEVNDKHLYISIFPRYHFYHTLNTNTASAKNIIVYNLDDQYKITVGSKEFIYSNLYEIMLWYNYYIHKYVHIQKKCDGHCMNGSYFSRIPSFYRNINNKKGLNVIKKALDELII